MPPPDSHSRRPRTGRDVIGVVVRLATRFSFYFELKPENDGAFSPIKHFNEIGSETRVNKNNSNNPKTPNFTVYYDKRKNQKVKLFLSNKYFSQKKKKKCSEKSVFAESWKISA